MNCAELEILLCDYVDGILSPVQRAALEEHISGCCPCAQLARDVAGVTAFVETVPAVEPPADLLASILHQIPARRSWWSRLGEGWFGALLEPRLALGMAMTILSFSMLARLGDVSTGELATAGLDPVRVWQALDDRTHRVWDRTVQYCDNMPLVMDLQSRWDEWSQQEQSQTGDTGNGR